MRKCRTCGSAMTIKLAHRGDFKGSYFWGCSKFPECRSLENTILKKISADDFWYGAYFHNSMKQINPDDIVTDAERHVATKNHFHYDEKFNNTDFTLLSFQLGFNDDSEFFFWIASQTKVVDHGVHNYFPVGSPYYFTFTNLVKAINQKFNDIINNLLVEKKDLIDCSVEYWLTLFREEIKRREEKSRAAMEREERRHSEAVERKANDATLKIFNAIRRKDIKAIIALRNKGADLTYKNEEGLDCVEYARTINDDRVLTALTCEIKDELSK